MSSVGASKMKISSCESCRAPERAPKSRAPVAGASIQSKKESSSLKLSLKTAEGDTVEISLQAQSVRQRERAYARGREGSVQQQSQSQTDRFSASVNVTGDLSEAELEDIRSLLSSLASGETPVAGEDELDTVSAYSYSYQRTREVSNTRVALYA
jgi:hypothetical protein